MRPSSPTPEAGVQVWTADILAHWDAVVVDLADRFGLDLHDPMVLARPWPGVRTLLYALLTEPSRLNTALRGDAP